MFSPWTLPSRSIWTTEEKVGSPTGRLQAADWGTLSMRPVCKCLQALGGQAQALGASTCAHEIEAPPPTLSLIRMMWRISRSEGELMFAFEPPEGWLVYCCRNTLETNKLTHTHRRKQSSWHILISISFLQFFFWIWSSCCNDALFQTLFRFVKWG